VTPDHATAASLEGRQVAVDARYLKRQVGISAYLRGGLRDLAAAGAALTLLTDDQEHQAELRAEYPAARAEVIAGRSGFLWEQRGLRRHLRRHDYDAFVAPANYGLPIAYRGRTALIVVVHDLIPLRMPDVYLLRRPLWAAKYLLSMAAVVLRADRFVAVSDATARDVARLLRRSAPDVVYPRLPAPYAPPAPAEPGLRPYFIYNGGADPRKNVAVLLRGFAAARDELAGIELVMLGSDVTRLRPLIRELGIDNEVRLPGFVDEATKMQLIHGALALVYPSAIEGFGLPVAEALAAGTPVISGSGGALPEVGGDAVTYLRPPTAESVAAALRAAASQPDPSREHSKARGLDQLSVLAKRQASHTLADAVAAAMPAGTVGPAGPAASAGPK
jgi:glycosyltransferase involved in cell wall biosynthesis